MSAAKDVAEGLPTDPQMQVEALTAAKIRTFLFEVAEGVSNYRSLHSLTEQIEHQYHGRFLIELIQNAHDALHEEPTADQPARIAIVLDLQDSPFGTLLVANDGQPFTRSNFERLDDGQANRCRDPGLDQMWAPVRTCKVLAGFKMLTGSRRYWPGAGAGAGAVSNAREAHTEHYRLAGRRHRLRGGRARCSSSRARATDSRRPPAAWPSPPTPHNPAVLAWGNLGWPQTGEFALAIGVEIARERTGRSAHLLEKDVWMVWALMHCPSPR